MESTPHTITFSPELTAAQLVPLFVELSTARRARSDSREAVDPEAQLAEDALYLIVLKRLHLAASVRSVSVTDSVL